MLSGTLSCFLRENCRMDGSVSPRDRWQGQGGPWGGARGLVVVTPSCLCRMGWARTPWVP